MNALERLMNRIEGRPVDRPPNMNIVMLFAARETGHRYGQVIRDGRLLAEGMLRCYERYGLDCLWAISDSVREPGDVGAEVVVPEQGVPYCPVPFIQEAEDLRKLKLIEPWDGPAMSDRIETVRILKAEARGEAPVVGWVEGAFAAACNFMDVEPFLMFLLEEPEAARELLDYCYELELKFALAQAAEGAEIIGIGDAVASLIGPRLYLDYAFDYERRMADALHAAGAKVKLHVCGNINPILDHIARTGADILDCDHMVDMARAGELMRGKGCVCGNFNPVTVALYGTPEDVRAAATRCAGLAENSIVAAGCEIPLDTDPANLLAVHEALCALGA